MSQRLVVAIAAGTLAILIALSGPASAETFTVDVEYTTQVYDAGQPGQRECVKKITVRPRNPEWCQGVNSAQAWDVCIDPQGHWDRGQDTHVLWVLAAASGEHLEGVSWWVEWEQSDPPNYRHCATDKNRMDKQVVWGKTKFKCKIKNTGRDDSGYWQYRITADDICDDAVSDPQIIFADGGGEPD